MGKPVSLFSGYVQRENRTTNYCLLMFKLIYEENAEYFSQVISNLIGESVGNKIGVNFLQQNKRGNSIPDGIIVQRPFVIYIETKLHEFFSESQIMNHLAALHQENSENKVLLALGNFETDQKKRLESIQEQADTKYGDKLLFISVSYEDLLDALEIENLSKSTLDAIDEFKNYLDEQNVLPNWKHQLDLVNCVGLPGDILNHGVYMCPAENGAYNHRRSKYFGMYRNKKVEKIALIEAVVDVMDDTEANIKWKNTDQSDSSYIDRALKKVVSTRNVFPTRIFILGDLHDTSFHKNSSGGFRGSKTYFDIEELDPIDEKDLAEKLKGRSWSEMR